MDEKLLIKELLKNTEILYDDKLKLEITKLSMRYSNEYKKLFIFGELVGEPNDYGIYVMVKFDTNLGIYEKDDETDSLFATFPGIQCFKCSLNIPQPLLNCNSIKIIVERKFLYARDRERDNRN